MNGLAGARVVVIDDEENEALPIIREFSKLGVPTIYFDGSISSLPANNKRMTGIRLIILDMDLVGGGVSEKSKVSALLGYLDKILGSDNGPYGILIWTKHADLQNLFETEIFNSPNIQNPIFTACISKIDCKDANGNFNLNRLNSKVSKALKSFSPLMILQKWEEACFISATQVTNELANLAVRDSVNFDDWRGKWKTEFLQIMRILAMAEAGQQFNADSCFGALYGSMNPLHSDRMERNTFGLRKSLSIYSSEVMDAIAAVDKKAKAKLNTMLHLSFNSAGGFYAGNIYTQSRLDVRIPSLRALLEDFTDGKDEKKKRAKEELTKVSKPIVMEVNATCDHSQSNIRVARFIAGLIVPEDKIKLTKQKTDFIYKLGPIFLESRSISAGVYYFYFSARHLLTYNIRQVKNANPFARLRGQAFADFQSWFAHRSSRPGMLLLTAEL